jgi:hypothetical protein
MKHKIGSIPISYPVCPWVPLHVCPTGVQTFPQKKKKKKWVRETGGSEDDGKEDVLGSS